MPDCPYTDDDLRNEAAKQHKNATEDFDFSGIGEQMDGTEPWTNLGDDAFDTAMRAVDGLLTSAADTSAWAVHLGADNLVPSTEHEITLDAGDKALARIHFAFAPDMPEEMRTNLVEGFEQALDDADASLDEPDPQDDGDADSDVFALISEIASSLRDATDSGEYHAVGLIYDLANSRTTIAEARAELADIEFGHV